MSQEKRSTWLKGIEQDITNNKTKKVIWALILLLSLISSYFNTDISNFSGISQDNLGLSSVIVIFISLVSILSYPEHHPNYLAYYFNQIGNELPGFVNEHNYLKRNQKLIKDCAKQIKHLSKQNTGYFSDNIIDLFDNLDEIVLHLNYIFTEGDVDKIYSNKENELSAKFIQLADIIHDNYSSLTPRHLELTNEILSLIKNTPVKTFEYHKLFIEKTMQKWAGQHHALRSFEVLFIAFFAFFYGFLHLMMKYGLEKETSVPYAIASSLGLLGILFNKIYLHSKR